MQKKTDSSSPVPRQEVVLITRFSALGDIAMTLPPVYDACLSNPEIQFVMVTRHHPAKMFINPPKNLTIHPVDTNDYPGAKGMFRLAKELKEKYGITDYADLHDVLRTRLLRFFLRLRGVRIKRVDKDHSARRRLTRPHNKHLVALRPMGLRYADTLRNVGAGGHGLFKSIFPAPPSPDTFNKVAPQKLPGEKWLAIAPFARHAGKIYPSDMMEILIGQLLEKGVDRLFIFGFGEEESRIICSWISRLSGSFPDAPRRIVDMAKENIGLQAELALISYCDAMLSMDSANMHLASLAGTRVVSIWGATHPYCGFRPASVADDDIIQLDMVCRPCSVFGNKKCRFGDYHCLRGIAPERVVQRLLNP